MSTTRTRAPLGARRRDQRQRRGGIAGDLRGSGRGPAGRILAFCWVGQGTYDSGDWDEASDEAQALVDGGTESAVDELMEMPMLASVLESGMATFDLSCDGIGDVS